MDISKLPQGTRDKLKEMAKILNSGQNQIDNIPLSARFFASSCLPRPLPEPIPVSHAKPYTGRGFRDQPAGRMPLAVGQQHQEERPAPKHQQYNQRLQQLQHQAGATAPYGPGQTPLEQYNAAQHRITASDAKAAAGTSGWCTPKNKNQPVANPASTSGPVSPPKSKWTWNPFAKPSPAGAAASAYGSGRPLGEAVESSSTSLSAPSVTPSLQAQQKAWSQWQQQMVQSPSTSILGRREQERLLQQMQQQQSQTGSLALAGATDDGRSVQQAPQLQWSGNGKQQWMPQPRQKANPYEAAQALAVSQGGSWVEQQSLMWQQHQQQLENQKPVPLNQQRSRQLDLYIRDAQHPWDDQEVALPYGAPRQQVRLPPPGLSSQGPLSWVEEQSLQWQKKQANMYSGQVPPPNVLPGRQYIVQHDGGPRTVEASRIDVGGGMRLPAPGESRQVMQDSQMPRQFTFQGSVQQPHMLTRQLSETSSTNGVWGAIPPDARPPFPPPVAQPARGEAWRVGDDDIPEFTHEEMLEQVVRCPGNCRFISFFF